MSSFISGLWGRLHANRPTPQTIMLVGLDNSGKTSLLACFKSSAARLCQAARVTTIDDSSPTTRSLDQDGHQLETSGSADNGRVSPTIGYNYERLQLGGRTVNVLDLSGQSKYRCLWQEFCNCVDAIIFVLDSSDLIRLVVARDELESLLAHPCFKSLKQPTGEQDGPLAFLTDQRQLIISHGKLIQSPLSQADNSSSTTKRTRQPNPTKCKRRSQVPVLFLANKTDLTNAADSELIANTLNLNQLPQERHPWHIQATSVRTSQGIREALDWLLKILAS